MSNFNLKNTIRRIIREEINSDYDPQTRDMKMKMYKDVLTLEKLTKNKVKIHKQVTATNMGTDDNPYMAASAILLIDGKKYLMMRGDEPNTYEITKFSKLSTGPNTPAPDFHGSIKKIAAQINFTGMFRSK